MRLLTNFVAITAVLFSTVVSAKTNGTTNVVPIIKQHHAALMASGENSISTTVFSSEISETGATTIIRVTSTRDGNDFQDFFSITTSFPYPNFFGEVYKVNFSFPDTPYGDSTVISYTEIDLPDVELHLWGDLIQTRYNNWIDALYPAIEGTAAAWGENLELTLTAEINLSYDFQDAFRIQYRTQLWDLYDGFLMEINPADNEGDSVDQQEWPVWIETWDLRPNLHPYQIVIYNDNGPIGLDNAPMMDSTLYAIAMTEENAGFWAGITDVQFYLDDSVNSFYETSTMELDSGDVSIDTSASFTFSSTSMHSIKVIVNQDSTINESDSTDNELEIFLNVGTIPTIPTIVLYSTQLTEWDELTAHWTGNDVNGDSLEYRSALDDTWTGWDTSTSVIHQDLTSGEHTFRIQVRDPGGLMSGDSLTFVIDQPVEVIDYSNVIITYGETLELDLVVTGGSGTYNYSAVYGTIDANGHYSWTPQYNSNPYSEVITANCVTWPNNYDSDGFLIEVNLSDVVIAGLDTNYVVLEEDILSDSDITATGGDNSSYNWTLAANTTDGDWLALTSSSGAVTGFTGTAPLVGNATVYDYSLECTSQTQGTMLEFTVTTFPLVSFAVESNYIFSHNNDAQIQLEVSGGDGNDYDWTVNDAGLLTIDSTSGNLVWLGVNTDDMGTFTVDVSCSQSNLPANSHSEQVSFTVGQSLWFIEPMEIEFPTTQEMQAMVINNTSVNGSTLAYVLTLSNETSYDIVSPLSGSLLAGESDTVQIVSHENNTPYEMTAQLDVNINDGAYTPVVNITTAASNTSLQAFSFNGGTSASQELTIWNNTDTEQNVALSNGNDVFTLSASQAVLAPGAFTIVYLSAADVEEAVYDTLHVLSEDIETYVLLRKYDTPENNIVYDDGTPQGTIGHNDAIVNSFTIVANDDLIGIEVYMRLNNQVFNWIVLDSDFNELASGEYTNSYIGWQQINLAVEDQQTSGAYYVGVKPAAASMDENVHVGYDSDSQSESYWYNNGSFELLTGTAFIRALTSGYVGVDDENIPVRFALNQNYPNPFNPTTTISYQLPKSAFVNLTVYNVAGQLIELLANEQKNAGFHSVVWSANNICSGLYFYRIEAGEYTETKKCLILK